MLALNPRGAPNGPARVSLRLRRSSEVTGLVDELLRQIYGPGESRRQSVATPSPDSDTGTLDWSCSEQGVCREALINSLHGKGVLELQRLLVSLTSHVEHAGSVLVKQLRRRDALTLRHDRHCDIITALLQAQSLKRRQDTRLRFSVAPLPGDSGFTQWHDAMKMVARLPGGIPAEFRRRLWLTLAEKHLQARGIDWPQTERAIFNEWSNPDDEELGIQIVKDLHRTGCSLFCGAAGERNQALLKRVLLAYARWNKAVGYCQGFNMLAALILQVMERSEGDSVKVMIYLIEGVLPESYFANNLRGLSVDMAVFRELLRIHLPSLSKHLETLQSEAGDIASGTSYEPPLTNVFTMQWFLTLFANCLPQTTVLRVWDLVFLEGNEVLLRAALAIWATLEDRIMAVESADEFYSIMGVLTREMLEFGLMDPNNLIKVMVTIAPFPFPELPELRDRYTYNITPWSHSVSNAARRGLRLFQSDDDEADDEEAADDEKMAVAAAFGISNVFRSSPRRRGSVTLSPALQGAAPPDKINLDISALKKQYSKLRERQRQAHIILTAACARPTGPTRQVATPSTAPVVMNHLLLGRSALMGVRRGGAGPVPATTALHQPQRGVRRQPLQTPKPPAPESGETLHWRDAKRRPSESIVVTKSPSPDQILSPPRARSSSSSSTSSASSHRSTSSGSTELCDEPDRMSDFDSEDTKSPGATRRNINQDKLSVLQLEPKDTRMTLPVLQLESDNDNVSPLKSPPSDPLSSPTEEASSQDQISQLSLSPILNSPSITIQNSPSSTIQNSSPVNPDSPTGFGSKHSFSDERMHSLSQEFSSVENIGASNYMPSLLDSPTKCTTPTILVSPIQNVLASPISETEISPITKIELSPIESEISPSIEINMSPIQSEISPIPQVDISPIQSKISPISQVAISPIKTEISPSIQVDVCPIQTEVSPIKEFKVPPIQPVITQVDSSIIPNFIDLNLSPKIEKKNFLFTKTASIDQATSPIDWNKLDSGIGRLQDNSPDLITSHWIESDVTAKTSNHTPLIMLDDNSESVFSPDPPTLQGSSPDPPNIQESGISTPLRMVPLGSLSASLSSPSSADEDITLPDLMVITPPKELSPLSPLKSPSWNNETIQWDASKFPFPSKSPIHWDKQSSSTKLEKSPKNDKFEWELPKAEVGKPEDNLINWDLVPKVEGTEKLAWKVWSESTADVSWKLGDSEWKSEGKEEKVEENWHSSKDLRESASEAPASPLPTLLKSGSESWHSIPPQFPTLNEIKPEINSELPTVTENVILETKPESKELKKTEVVETRSVNRADRKRWTIAEPIAWSVICDAISQQQENQQRPVSPLVEEEEETVKEVTPVERGAFGRRNSERALQIIQENSEILQRIMRESRGKQMMDRETRASRPTTIGLGGSRGVRWGSQRELASEVPSNSSTPPMVESPTHTATWKPSTCFPSLGESPQNVNPAPFNPFPVRPKPQTRELGVRLGLYPTRQLSK